MKIQGVHDFLAQVINQRCWYASAGGSVGSTFSLSFGDRLQRQIPLNNQSHSPEFREYCGEYALFCWCSWRLSKLDRFVASSTSVEASVCRALDGLVGQSIDNIIAQEPYFDLSVSLTGGYRLELFCNNANDFFDGDWELTTREEVVYVGPGGNVSFQPRGDVIRDPG